ncbi:MAG: hypothetical protein IT373_30960 [Polyangiaceae bacterium]|nr:hypothetical protein [Polyangiaceae bacterium]
MGRRSACAMLGAILAAALAASPCPGKLHMNPMRILKPKLMTGSFFVDVETPSSHHGFPMPVVEQGRLRLAVISCPERMLAPEFGLLLFEPMFLMIYDPESGERIEARVASADTVGLPVGGEREKRLGIDRLAAGQSAESYLADERAALDAMDILLPAFAEGRMTNGDATLRAAARTFQKSFTRISEPVLAPYYAYVGREWFAWLAEVAK